MISVLALHWFGKISIMLASVDTRRGSQHCRNFIIDKLLREALSPQDKALSEGLLFLTLH